MNHPLTLPRTPFTFLVLIFSLFFPLSAMASPVWTTHTDAGSRNWTDFASSADGEKLAAVAYGNYIYTSTDGGTTWTPRTVAGSRDWWTITSSSDGTKLAAADYGGYIYTSIDSGVTWTERTLAGERLWYMIASSADGSRIVASGCLAVDGYNCRIFVSDDSGATWVESTDIGLGDWYSIAMSTDGMTVITANYDSPNSYIYKSTDGGINWTALTSAGSRYWYAVAMSGDGLKMVGGDNYPAGYIYLSEDGGSIWSALTSVGTGNWYWLTISSDGSNIAAINGTNYHLQTSTDSGATWTDQTSFAGDDQYYSVDASADGSQLLTGGYTGYIRTGILAFAPVLSNQVVNDDHTSATLTYDTDISSDSRASYGLDASYGNTMTGTSAVTNHSITISPLTCDTTYHYQLASAEPSYGLTASSTDATFTTTCPSSSRGGGTNASQRCASGTVWDPSQLACSPVQIHTTPTSILPSAPTQATTTFSFSINRQLFDKGEDIVSIQKYLNSHGFPITNSGYGSIGQETSFFGTLTFVALKKFQQSVGLPATGYFGPMTRGYINSH